MSLKDQVIVITGAGGVLCGAFAEHLATQGAHIALLDLNKDACAQIAEKIEKNGGKAKAYACDVLKSDVVEAVEKEIVKDFGGYNILINGAGGNNPKGNTTKETYEKGDENNADITTFFNIDPSNIDFVFKINFTGTFIPSQVFSKGLLNKPGASILNVSSMNAFCPLTKIPAYSAAKAAVSNFTQWLAVHLAPAGIRVNAMAPGFFETIQNAKLLRTENGELTARSHKILSHTPQGRFGVNEDLFGTLVWLCDSTLSGFVTGTVIPIDGGFSAYSGV
ncbi:MAG: SDR family oxidoreductase [Spirochaetia bacterium]